MSTGSQAHLPTPTRPCGMPAPGTAALLTCCADAEARAWGRADLQSLQRRLLLCREERGRSPKTKSQSLAPADSPTTAEHLKLRARFCFS